MSAICPLRTRLSANAIGDEGVGALAEGLKVNGSLLHLRYGMLLHRWYTAVITIVSATACPTTPSGRQERRRLQKPSQSTAVSLNSGTFIASLYRCMASSHRNEHRPALLQLGWEPNLRPGSPSPGSGAEDQLFPQGARVRNTRAHTPFRGLDVGLMCAVVVVATVRLAHASLTKAGAEALSFALKTNTTLLHLK